MICPDCRYDLSGSAGYSCPECGAKLIIMTRHPLKGASRLLKIGLALILVFCIAQTIWFWREMHMYQVFVFETGGTPDPIDFAFDVRIIMFARYGANICLGLGLAFVTIGLGQALQRMVIALDAMDRKTQECDPTAPDHPAP